MKIWAGSEMIKSSEIPDFFLYSYLRCTHSGFCFFLFIKNRIERIEKNFVKITFYLADYTIFFSKSVNAIAKNYLLSRKSYKIFIYVYDVITFVLFNLLTLCVGKVVNFIIKMLKPNANIFQTQNGLESLHTVTVYNALKM